MRERNHRGIWIFDRGGRDRFSRPGVFIQRVKTGWFSGSACQGFLKIYIRIGGGVVESLYGGIWKDHYHFGNWNSMFYNPLL